MRHLLRLAIWAGLLAVNLVAATIEFTVTDIGQNQERFTYSLAGVTLLANQEVDIRFDPALYADLSNGVAPADFSLLVLQPNQPPGSFGDYSVLALVDHPNVSGVFSVDLQFLGTGTPGTQEFLINQYQADGLTFVGVIGQGTAINSNTITTVMPEPGTFLPGGAGLLISGILGALRRRAARATGNSRT